MRRDSVLIVISGYPRPCPRKSSIGCTHLPSPTIPSPVQTHCATTMASSSAYPLATATSLASGRYVLPSSCVHVHIAERCSQAFWDTTGQLWSQGALSGKFCSAFVSTSSQGGGQEMTVANAMSTFVHHGMIFVPLGYSRVFKQLGNNDEVHGGTLDLSNLTNYSTRRLTFNFRIGLGRRYLRWRRWLASAHTS